jgi:hypothetical protein
MAQISLKAIIIGMMAFILFVTLSFGIMLDLYDEDNLNIDLSENNQTSSLGDLNILEDRLEEIRMDLNKRLPSASRIHRFVIQKEPFIKTPTRKIKRAFYVEGY